MSDNVKNSPGPRLSNPSTQYAFFVSTHPNPVQNFSIFLTNRESPESYKASTCNQRIGPKIPKKPASTIKIHSHQNHHVIHQKPIHRFIQPAHQDITVFERTTTTLGRNTHKEQSQFRSHQRT